MDSEDLDFIYDASGARRRVLVVCGEPQALAEIKKELMGRFEVGIAATGEAALSALSARGADAVVIYIGEVSDWAFSVFDRLSAHAADSGTPVLFLAERDDQADEARAFGMGAADYALKRRVSGALASRIGLRVRAAEARRSPGGDVCAETPETVLTGRTILIAEDIELNREIIAALLSGIKDLTVAFAANGREAVELFERDPGLYSLIFMDIHMPEMDGLTATRAIRSLPCPEAGTVPIIALTATAGREESAEFQQAGMSGYLQKPMEYGEFLRVCAAYCGQA